MKKRGSLLEQLFVFLERIAHKMYYPYVKHLAIISAQPCTLIMYTFCIRGLV